MKKRLLLGIVVLSCFFKQAGAQGAGYAIDMTSVARYVSIPNTQSLNPAAQITVEAWIYPTAWGVNFWTNSIVSKDDWSVGTRGFVMRCGANGTISFNLGTTVGWREAVSPANSMQLNRWHHVAGTYDGTQIRVYVDGVQKGFTNFTGTMAASTYDMTIGQSAYHTASSRPFEGWIDEVRMWEQALPDSVIRQWMNRKVTVNHPAEAFLLGNWSFDEGQGTLVNDGSFFQNHGSLINDPVWRASGAAIGDTVVAVTAAPFSAMLERAGLDKVGVSGFSSNPIAVYLYRVNQPQLTGQLPAGHAMTLDSSRSWGVFVVGADTSSYSVDIELFEANGLHRCASGLFWRLQGSDTIWTDPALSLSQQRDIRFSRTGSSQWAVAGAGSTLLSTTESLTFCTGGSALFAATPSTGFSYQWLHNGTPVPGATNPTLNAVLNGLYQLEVRDGAGCRDSSEVITLSVLPAPDAVITRQNDTLFTGTFSSYQWFRNNNILMGANQQFYRPTQNGDYRVLVSNADNCTDTSAAFVHFMTSVAETGEENIKVWPNPAINLITVSLQDPAPATLSLLDIRGRVCLRASPGELQLKTGELTRGLYLLRIEQGVKVMVRKVVLE